MKLQEFVKAKKYHMLISFVVVVAMIAGMVLLVSGDDKKEEKENRKVVEAVQTQTTDKVKETETIPEEDTTTEEITETEETTTQNPETEESTTVVAEESKTANSQEESTQKRTEGSKEKTQATEELTTNVAEQKISEEVTSQKMIQKEENTPTAQSVQPVQPVATQPVQEVTTKEQPTACPHTSSTKKVTKAATAESDGTWGKVCDKCGTVLESGSIHAYSAYRVDIGGGNTATVYGYYEEDAAAEIFRQLNEYRAENGLSALENRFHAEANVRAVESAYMFGHDRPNGYDCNELNVKINGENLASRLYFKGETGEIIAFNLMSQWKASYGHNLNMLTGDELVGIGVFIKMEIDENGIATPHKTYAVQLFGTDRDIWDF